MSDNAKRYVVSDENGHYIEYCSTRLAAESRAEEGNAELRERGEEFGSYAVGILTSEGHYYIFDWS